jgi:hypothetical protein
LKYDPPRPFECCCGQPLAQHDVPPTQHWPEQPEAGPAAQWHAPPLHVPPAHGMHAPLHGSSPAGHWHPVAVQVAPVAQVVPHPPQFCGSEVKLTHAVAHAFGSEAGQAQALEEQISFVRVHAVPQPPQFAGSFVVFTQAVGEPVGHGVGSDGGHAHVPAEQASCASGQACPQPPTPAQFCGSLCVSVQTVPQSSGFVPPHAHTPATQVEPGLFAVQLVPHVPHAPASVWRFRQRGTSASQRSSPAGHWHRPPEHVAPAPQRTPHAPQLLASVWYVAGSTHAPPHSTPVQSWLFEEQPAPRTVSRKTAREVTGRAMGE